jgi:hypothetical protein
MLHLHRAIRRHLDGVVPLPRQRTADVPFDGT